MTKEQRNFGFMIFGKAIRFYSSKNHGFLVGDDHQLFPVDSKEDFIEFMSDWFDECQKLAKGYEKR